MAFELSGVVPWGRSFAEYRRMFALSGADLRRRLLGCADGPASFNAEATAVGCRVTSCDPLYRFSADDIRRRIDECFDEVLAQARQNQAQFVWKAIPSVDALAAVRREAMERFLADYRQADGDRYVAAELPRLPFPDGAFDLGLCSHYLFLYSQHLDEEFHHRAVAELLRVSREVRVFPLLELTGDVSRHVEPVRDSLRQRGWEASIEGVDYEFQRGGNQMLRIRARRRL